LAGKKPNIDGYIKNIYSLIMYSTGIAYLLWLFSIGGWFGLHRLYLGKIPTGILWMCTAGLGGIGSIYDLLTLPSQVREANVKKAIYDSSIIGKIGRQLSWRDILDVDPRVVREKESVEHVILKLAKANKGILTASELALSANISMEEAKKDLDALVTKGFAELRVRQSGNLVYTIPDLMDSDEPLVD
jgi:TM2 domain-containing membrane protein YozV/predicted transcriptional regulator